MPDNNPRSVTKHYSEEMMTVPSTDKVELDGRLFRGDARKHTCVILTHPYGPLGGNFENNVVKALFDNFASQGFMTVRFNFRGTGRSTGRTSFKGQGEQDDILAICRYIREKEHIRPKHIMLCGYSYGAVAAGGVATQIPELSGFIAVSYPIGVLWALTFFGTNKFKTSLAGIPSHIPKLYITGGKDGFTSLETFTTFVESLPKENITSVVVKEANHFWVDGTQENQLVAHINQWLGKTGLNAKGGRMAASALLQRGTGVVSSATIPPSSPSAR
ncbi:Alpha/Beta hydrolase protein [Fimicolochytrium jonesii]|uniref:Alpha/Beta hydrolase protein n=1 Tax=Fimicolochytrium jonesii TaxID=1396493 RepID=UPI0022FF106D|nr:Alpha/Beta hydrolase protein [Fimicolochytrium jonesii]KAI8822524.1 Alpha/Beta hydrolase protein [Fimicolochytrium jonesii]